MKISSKGKYALASMVVLADHFASGEPVAVVNIANSLGVSKIYLEQVFSLLKRSELVVSIKGAFGGYKLKSNPEQISIYEILFAVEKSLFDKPSHSLGEDAKYIEDAMDTLIWEKADATLQDVFRGITLDNLLNESNHNKKGNDYMFFI